MALLNSSFEDVTWAESMMGHILGEFVSSGPCCSLDHRALESKRQAKGPGSLARTASAAVRPARRSRGGREVGDEGVVGGEYQGSHCSGHDAMRAIE